MKGIHSVVITGPSGVIFSAQIDLEKRDMPLALAVDDVRLPELLVITALSAGAVDAEILKREGQL